MKPTALLSGRPRILFYTSMHCYSWLISLGQRIPKILLHTWWFTGIDKSTAMTASSPPDIEAAILSSLHMCDPVLVNQSLDRPNIFLSASKAGPYTPVRPVRP